MAKVLLRSPWHGVPMARVAGVLAIGALFLGAALTASAQSPGSSRQGQEGAASDRSKNRPRSSTSASTRSGKKTRSRPPDRCDDYTFIRRASLDIIGRIPKVRRSSSS